MLKQLGRWSDVRRTVEPLLTGPGYGRPPGRPESIHVHARLTDPPCEGVCLHRADDWELLTAYIDAFFHMNEDLTARDLPYVATAAAPQTVVVLPPFELAASCVSFDGVARTHDALFHAADFLRKLAETSSTQARPMRGPFLARLELQSRLLDKFGTSDKPTQPPMLLQVHRLVHTLTDGPVALLFPWA